MAVHDSTVPSPSEFPQVYSGELVSSLMTTATRHAAGEAITAPEFISQQDPQLVLERAEKVAKALKSFLDRKESKVVFNGKRYPQAEDWQFVGAFFGHTARVRSTEELIADDQVEGYIAIAEVVDQSGRVVSAAEAACTRDERNWESKPDFQLRSMAQTRACAKSLRNVFAWVMILAGLAPTPAEEMTEETATPHVATPRRKSEASPAVDETSVSSTITEGQQKRLFAIAREHGISKDDVREILGEYGFEFSREITKRAYPAIVRRIEESGSKQ